MSASFSGENVSPLRLAIACKVPFVSSFCSVLNAAPALGLDAEHSVVCWKCFVFPRHQAVGLPCGSRYLDRYLEQPHHQGARQLVIVVYQTVLDGGPRMGRVESIDSVGDGMTLEDRPLNEPHGKVAESGSLAHPTAV